MSDPRYPVGEFTHTGPLDPERRRDCIVRIAAAPALLRAAVAGRRRRGWTEPAAPAPA